MIVRSVAELRTTLAIVRRAGKTIGFVPTMGALHDGHLSLVRAASASTGCVVVSIFVNPLQFGPREDFAAYPRDESNDVALAEEAGVDVMFLPSVGEMFPDGRSTTVSVGELGSLLEGADRPGHFDGVATVVAKLFNQVQPQIAFFGQKDAQQVAVIRRMVADLSINLEVSVEPTVREPDGLAMSSRNAYLAPETRLKATALYRALLEGAETLRRKGVAAAEKKMWDLLVAEGLEPSYAKAVDPDTFGPPSGSDEALLVIAARVGTTRLIDNLLLKN